MTDPTVNVPLLRKMAEWVEEQEALPVDEREWRQEWWAQPAPCGTAYCVAGKIATDAGYTVDHTDGRVEGGRSAADVALELLGPLSFSALFTTDGYLFAGDNSAADVRRIAEDLAGERL